MNSIRKKLSAPWLDALLALISTLIGLFIGKFLEAIVPPLFAPANLPSIAFILVSVLFLANAIYSITLWRSTNDSVASVANRANELAKAVGHRVKTVSYTEGYKELEKRINRAEDRILIFTVYTFDWENKKQIWDVKRSRSPERKSFYTVLHKKLQKLKNEKEKNARNFCFEQIIQIPENHNLVETLNYDPILKENCEFIANLSPREPEFASLKTVSGRLFSNSIIIIDRSFAHISFDIQYPRGSEVVAPFVLLIDDPNSEALSNLHTLYERIKTFAVLVEKSDLMASEKSQAY